MGAKVRVLVVDDNHELAEIVAEHLSVQGLSAQMVHSAAEAESAFSGSSWDVLITDLLLPDRTGHRLLARLAQLGPLPPVFVISGVFRGPDAQRQVSEVAPVAGWFEKPFDARLLAQCVCKALGRPFKAPVVKSAAVDQALRTYDSVRPLISSSQKKPLTAPEPIWDRNTQLAPKSGLSGGSSFQIGSMVGVDPFRDAHSGFGRSTTPSADDMSTGLRTQLKTGSLRTVPAPRLLGAFHVAKETAEVAFENQDRRQIVYFQGGRPVYAMSNRIEDRLGYLLQREMKVEGPALKAAFIAAKEQRRAFDTVVVERGLVARKDLQKLMQRQTHRLLLDLFRWADGEYTIRFRRRADVPHAGIDEDTAHFVLNGVRDWFTLARLQELVPETARPLPSPNSPFPLFGLPLLDTEATFLLRVTGARTVRDLIDNAPPDINERQARAVLYGLLSLGVLVSGRSMASGSPS